MRDAELQKMVKTASLPLLQIQKASNFTLEKALPKTLKVLLEKLKAKTFRILGH